MRCQRSSKKGDDLNPGDLIEIIHLTYEHWAIYVGDGYVIHLTVPGGGAGASSASLRSAHTKKAVVKKEELVDVLHSNRWWVNNKYDSKYDPLPLSEIISRAEAEVGSEVAYNVTSNNCEHFVTKLRYGVAMCKQVQNQAWMIGTSLAFAIPCVLQPCLPVGILAIAGSIAVIHFTVVRN